MTLQQYTDTLAACIRVLPKSMVIHRLTGDGAKRDLLAPLWTGDKKRVLNQIPRAFWALDLEPGTGLDIPDAGIIIESSSERSR
jgi:radical SAM superfamily enzyme